MVRTNILRFQIIYPDQLLQTKSWKDNWANLSTYFKYPEFAEALTLADHVVLANIYAARETDTLGISSADLQKRIQELGTPCEYFPTFDEIENYLLENCQPGDLLITMGAGDVYQIGEKLLGK